MKNKKKTNKRTKIIIILAAAIILIAAGVGFYFLGKATLGDNGEKGTLTEEGMKNYVEELTELLINGGTKEELIKKIGSENILDTDIMTGKDMYLRQKPDDAIISKYNLDNYVTLGEELATTLENAIKNNFEYKITDVIDNNDFTSVTVAYKTFYYAGYINDLSQVQNNLLTRAGYDLDTVSITDEFQADSYKAKIKAAYLLNNYLDNYRNENENNETIVSFMNDNPTESADEFLSYLMNITGYAYTNFGNLNTQADIDNFLSNFDLTNPLAI